MSFSFLTLYLLFSIKPTPTTICKEISNTFINLTNKKISLKTYLEDDTNGNEN